MSSKMKSVVIPTINHDLTRKKQLKARRAKVKAMQELHEREMVEEQPNIVPNYGHPPQRMREDGNTNPTMGEIPDEATQLPTRGPQNAAAAQHVSLIMSQGLGPKVKDLEEEVQRTKRSIEDVKQSVHDLTTLLTNRMDELMNIVERLQNGPAHDAARLRRRTDLCAFISPLLQNLPADKRNTDYTLNFVYSVVQAEQWTPKVEDREFNDAFHQVLEELTNKSITMPTTAKSSRPSEVNSNRIPIPSKFTGKLDTHITNTKTWFDLLMQYFDLHQMQPLEHFVYWLSGKAAEWGTSLFNLHISGTQVLTRQTLRNAFLLQYGDTHRNTAMAARERLHKHEYDMKSDDSVPEYTQRFYETTREASDMSERDRIAWYIAGLVPALRGRCATDDEGKDWESLEKLILYAVGQETRWKAGRSKMADLHVQSIDETKPKRLPFKRPAKQGNTSFKVHKKQKPSPGGSGGPHGKSDTTRCRQCNQTKPASQSWQDHKKTDCISNLEEQQKRTQAKLDQMKRSAMQTD